MPKDRPIVLVDAVDWATYEDSFNLPDKFPPMPGRIVGFLIEENDDYISVAFEDFTDGDHEKARIILSIPMVCVKSIKYLEEKKDV